MPISSTNNGNSNAPKPNEDVFPKFFLLAFLTPCGKCRKNEKGNEKLYSPRLSFMKLNNLRIGFIGCVFVASLTGCYTSGDYAATRDQTLSSVQEKNKITKHLGKPITIIDKAKAPTGVSFTLPKVFTSTAASSPDADGLKLAVNWRVGLEGNLGDGPVIYFTSFPADDTVDTGAKLQEIAAIAKLLMPEAAISIEDVPPTISPSRQESPPMQSLTISGTQPFTIQKAKTPQTQLPGVLQAYVVKSSTHVVIITFRATQEKYDSANLAEAIPASMSTVQAK
jgi:hypothetical protein